MIRSNPTLIPLRATDVKILQAQIEARRADREAKEKLEVHHKAKAARGGTNVNTPQSAAALKKSRQVVAAHLAAQAAANAPAPGDEEGEERRRRRAGMTAQERIGL